MRIAELEVRRFAEGCGSQPTGPAAGAHRENFTDRAIVYSSVIDNRTSDPTFRLAMEK